MTALYLKMTTLQHSYIMPNCQKLLLRHTTTVHHHHTSTVLWPCFRDHPGEPVPEENLWTLWCKGRLTKADTPSDWAPLHPD